MLFAASTQTTIGIVILFVAVVIAVVYAFINIRQARPEIGSEIELAPNRKPYYSDEELEGTQARPHPHLRAARASSSSPSACRCTGSTSRAGRRAPASNFKRRRSSTGAPAMFDTTENGGFNCAFCHGGMEGVGGAAPFTITDANGQFVKQVEWKAPGAQHRAAALQPGRGPLHPRSTAGPSRPMPAWGVKGGGPLNEQQLQNLIDYIESIQRSTSHRRRRAATEAPGRGRRRGRGSEHGRRRGGRRCPYVQPRARRCSTSATTRLRRRRLLLRSLPHHGLVVRREGPRRQRGPRPVRCGAASAPPGSPASSTGFNQQVDFVCTGSEQGVELRPELGRAPVACRASARRRPRSTTRRDRRGRRRRPRALGSRHGRRHVRPRRTSRRSSLRQGPVNLWI